MQSLPHPDTWFLDWLTGQKLVADDVLRAAYARFIKERRNAPDSEPELTLGRLLEREGLLTSEQREAGEREALSREKSFMAWRSEALRRQHPPHPEGM